MVFSRVGRTKPKPVGNFGTCRWYTGFGYNLLNNIKNILLLCGKFQHFSTFGYCMYIQFSLFPDRFKRV